MKDPDEHIDHLILLYLFHRIMNLIKLHVNSFYKMVKIWLFHIFSMLITPHCLQSLRFILDLTISVSFIFQKLLGIRVIILTW